MTTEKNNISLRDHFAGVALQGLLASPVMGDCALHDSAAEWVKEMTECAYEFADAMMEEREKGLKVQVKQDEVLSENLVEWLGHVSVRVINALSEEGINTVDDLCKCTEWYLKKVPGLGRISLCEIKEELAQRGLSLQMGTFCDFYPKKSVYR